LLGERFFAAAAYGVPVLGRDQDPVPTAARRGVRDFLIPPELADMRKLAAGAAQWADDLAAQLVELDFPVLGCSTTFFQTAASVALLNRVKRRRPGVVTILGGANCEGEMAQGILSLGAGIDFVFSGESESAFPQFLRDRRARRPMSWPA